MNIDVEFIALVLSSIITVSYCSVHVFTLHLCIFSYFRKSCSIKYTAILYKSYCKLCDLVMVPYNFTDIHRPRIVHV